VPDLKEHSQKTRQELILLVDVSKATNSSRACQMIEEFIAQLPSSTTGAVVDLNAGDLLLTKGVMLKIKQQLHRAGVLLGTVYSTVPQTQQAALDEGLYVKEKLQSQWTPLRQPLPIPPVEKPKQIISPEITVNKNPSKPLNVDLPDFSQPAPVAQAPKAVESIASLPVKEEIPELPIAVVEMETLVEPVISVREENIPTQEVDLPETAFDTLYLRQTLRSGQTVRFDGHVIIVGDVHAGSEITAGGDIVVWGELRGIAHAGAKGNFKSEIRAMKIEALQLRIADYIARRPDRIYYHKDGAETVISPEAARVADGEIKIFKTVLAKN
jgi:septum formation inhibitor MinC